MSDTAPLFSGEVVEVLRSQTILDLQEELEKGNRHQYRIVITQSDELLPDADTGRILAEGYLDETELIDRDALSSFYSKILPAPEDDFFWKDRTYKAVKLRNVDACLGDSNLFEDPFFAIKLGDGVRVKLAQTAEGTNYYPRDCLHRFIGDADLDRSDRATIEVNGCKLTFTNIVYRYCLSGNPDKDDFPEGQGFEERDAMMEDIPAGGIKVVFECALFQWKPLLTSLEGQS
jgi:hypothetical protein